MYSSEVSPRDARELLLPLREKDGSELLKQLEMLVVKYGIFIDDTDLESFAQTCRSVARAHQTARRG